MTAFGYLFALLGVLLVRQVAVGRAKETGEDARDIALAFLSADTGQMAEVFGRRGQNVSVEGSGEVATDPSTGSDTQIAGNNALAQETVKLGNAARGYVWGAVGPTYYDCSGLIWRAAKNIGVYNGPRFTTSSFRSISGGWVQSVNNPTVGDIAVWPTKHMGVVVGPDKLYSARSPSKGITTSSISADSRYFGMRPEYWRVRG